MKNIEKYFSDNDIRELIKNSILNRKEKFYRHHLWNLLSVFSDKKKYFKIIRSVYSEIYGSDLITVNEFIATYILVYLPNDERYEIAKKKFLTDISWYTSINLGYCNSQWVCLLSIKESIPIIKERLKKASDPYDRYLFWKLIVLTCKINEDRNALKDFLTLLYDRYRNDHTILVFNILLYVTEEFDLDNSLCVKIERLIKILYQRNAFNHKVTGSCSSYSYKNHRNVSLSKLEFSNVQVLLDKILECKILDRCEDINEFIKIYCRIYIDFNQYCDFFKNISENNIKKKCLLLTLTQLQSEIYKEKKLNIFEIYRILYDLFRSIKHINKENSNKKNIDIRDYSWILNEVSIIINENRYNEFPNVCKFTEFIYQELPELLHTKNLIKIENSANLIPPFLLRCLKKDYKESLNSIDDILNILLSTIDTDKLTRYYINCCSWYNMFSLTLLDKLVVKLKEDNTGNVFKCLAMICDKSDLEELVKNISPEKYKDCVEEDKKKELIIFYKSVLKGLSMSNDLVNFKYVECLCQGEYFVEVINHMQNLALRYPVNQVSTFAMKLIKDRVSLRKQGLAIFYKIESFTNIISINNDILKNENNLSIRGLMYETILRMFLLHKTQETWLILLDSLKFVKIDDEIWELYLNINQISNEYRCQYIIEILRAIDNIYYLDTKDSRIFFKSNVSRILNLIILQQDSLTEEVDSYIFDNYYKNFIRLDHLEKDAQIDYLFIIYLGSAEESFDKRLENAIDLFFGNEDIKKEKLPDFGLKTSPLEEYMTRMFYYRNEIPFSKYKKIFDRFREMYTSKFDPMMNPKIYIMLIIFNKDAPTTSYKEISDNVKRELPNLINVFGKGSIAEISKICKNNILPFYNFDYQKYSEELVNLIDILLDENDEDIVLFASYIAYSMSFSSKREKKILHKMSSHSISTVRMLYNLICKKQNFSSINY